MRITVNNGTMTREKAMKEAKEIHDQTSCPVEVSTTCGDPIAYFINGECIIY